MQIDQSLMRRVKEGDRSAFADLVGRNRVAAEAYARRILGDQRLAEEVVQDSFVKVYLLRERYRDSFSFRAYLYALVRNRCVDLLRRQTKNASLSLEALEEAGADAAASCDSPEAAYLRAEGWLRLWSAIEKLPAEEKKLLLRFACGQKTYRQLAQEGRMSVAQVKIKLHRIRQKIKKTREDDHEGLY